MSGFDRAFSKQHGGQDNAGEGVALPKGGLGFLVDAIHAGNAAAPRENSLSDESGREAAARHPGRALEAATSGKYRR